MKSSIGRLIIGDDASPVPQYAAYGEAARAAAEHLSILPMRERLELHQFLIEPHFHPHHEQLVLVRRGGGTVTLEGRDYALRAPAVLIVPACTVHGFSCEKDTEGSVLTVARTYVQQIMTRAPEFSDIFAAGHCIEYSDQDPAYAEIERVVGKMEWELRRSARCREIATEALLIDLLVGLTRNVQHGRSQGVSENGSYQEAYRQFMAMVEAHHRENWSLEKFAAALRTSIPRLRSICRSVGGESPVRILNARIILEAKRCLSYTNMSVSEISYRLGFEDPSYFSRFFRVRCGQTPTQYKATRKNLLRAPEAPRLESQQRGSEWHTNQ
ncbi:MAG: helix-turn-helix domain-containing protein [Gammaproteobacteria bacterium]